MARKKAAVDPYVLEHAQTLASGNWPSGFAQQVKALGIETHIPLAAESFLRLVDLLPSQTFASQERTWYAILILALTAKAAASGKTDAFSNDLARVGSDEFEHSSFVASLREVMTASPRALKTFDEALNRGLHAIDAFMQAEKFRFPMNTR